MRLKEIHAVCNKKSLEQDNVRPLFISKITLKLPQNITMQLGAVKYRQVRLSVIYKTPKNCFVQKKQFYNFFLPKVCFS